MNDDDLIPTDPKDAAILRAALVVFSRYGLRRTAMADIAEAAGMSRPALYLRFRSKEDIFNALVRLFAAQSERAVAQILSDPGPASDTILAIFVAMDGEMAEQMMSSPHAHEILSENLPYNHAEIQQANARIAAHIAGWIATGVAAGRLSLQGLDATPTEVAELIMAAKLGVKSSSKDFAAYRAAEARLAAVFGKALSN